MTRTSVPGGMPGYLMLWRARRRGALPGGVLLAALRGDITQLKYWSQVSTLTVALTATASVLTFAVRSAPVGHGCSPGAAAPRRPTRSSPPSSTRLLLSGYLESTSSLLEHALVPALAVLDWVLIGPGAGRQRWWAPPSWLILPICYLGVYFNARDDSGRSLYPFLNPRASNFCTVGG